MEDQFEMPSVPDAAQSPQYSAWELELLGITADANELINRIHSGQPGDLDALIGCVIAERPAPVPVELPIENKPEVPVEMHDAA